MYYIVVFVIEVGTQLIRPTQLNYLSKTLHVELEGIIYV